MTSDLYAAKQRIINEQGEEIKKLKANLNLAIGVLQDAALGQQQSPSLKAYEQHISYTAKEALKGIKENKTWKTK